jgi:hypothetical protein
MSQSPLLGRTCPKCSFITGDLKPLIVEFFSQCCVPVSDLLSATLELSSRVDSVDMAPLLGQLSDLWMWPLQKISLKNNMLDLSTGRFPTVSWRLDAMLLMPYLSTVLDRAVARQS